MSVSLIDCGVSLFVPRLGITHDGQVDAVYLPHQDWNPNCIESSISWSTKMDSLGVPLPCYS